MYVKMNAPEDILLSEGVFQQPGILTYHLKVQPLRTTRGDKTGAGTMVTEENA